MVAGHTDEDHPDPLLLLLLTSAVSRVKPESGQTFADEPARTPELRSQREVQDTHNEARITRCRMFWGVLVGLQALPVIGCFICAFAGSCCTVSACGRMR